jgi:HEAT repeat protein
MPSRTLVTLFVILAQAAFPSRSGAAEEPKEELPPMLTLSEAQRQFLATVTAWKIEVSHDYPHATNREVPILRDCETILKRAGYQTDASGATVLLKIRVKGSAQSASYMASPSLRYSGAELIINASLITTDPAPKTVLSFSEVRGVRETPWSISGGYLTPADAPFVETYGECAGFDAQLFSVLLAVKGTRPIYDCTAEYYLSKNAFTFIRASGERSFVPLLIADLLAGKGTALGYIAGCLGALGDLRAVEPLCMSLTDKQGNVCLPVVAALAKLGDARAISHLRGALLSTNALGTWASLAGSEVASALRTLDWRPETAREKVLYYLALNETNQLQAMKGAAVPVLLDLLNEEKGRSEVAARLLGTMKEPSAIVPLSKALLGSKRYGLRLAAAEALPEIGTAQAMEPLATALMSDSESRIRAACAKGLGVVGGALAPKFLGQAVLGDKDQAVVVAAAQALGRLKDRAGVEYLTRSLNHSNSAVRLEATQALREIGDAKAVPALRDRLEKETAKPVQESMIAAMAALGVEPKELSFTGRLRLLAEKKQWEEIRSFLDGQPTENVIEALALEEELVNKTARFILVTRTGKYDLQGHAAWKQWWDTEGKNQPKP